MSDSWNSPQYPHPDQLERSSLRRYSLSGQSRLLDDDSMITVDDWPKDFTAFPRGADDPQFGPSGDYPSRLYQGLASLQPPSQTGPPWTHGQGFSGRGPESESPEFLTPSFARGQASRDTSNSLNTDSLPSLSYASSHLSPSTILNIPPPPAGQVRRNTSIPTLTLEAASSDQPQALDVCVVCGSTNGPWRRGPLGVRIGTRLCNSCGHIEGSKTPARSYEEALYLLENLRVTRLGRVQRRHDAAEMAPLLRRLQQLSARTLRLTREIFPADSSSSNFQALGERGSRSFASPQVSWGRLEDQVPRRAFPPLASRRSSSQLAPSEASSSGRSELQNFDFTSRFASSSRHQLNLLPPLGSLLSSNSRTSISTAPSRSRSTLLTPLEPPLPPFRTTTDPSAYALDTYRSSSTSNLLGEPMLMSPPLPSRWGLQHLDTLPPLPPLPPLFPASSSRTLLPPHSRRRSNSFDGRPLYSSNELPRFGQNRSPV